MPEVRIREATLADGPALAEVERRAPLVFGEGALVLDRGDDYFAAARLMEDVVVLLAEVDGEPAGVLCGAFHRARVGGVTRRLMYVHHARIDSAYQRVGLGRALAQRLRAIMDERRGVDSQYWYISKANAASQAFVAASPGKWSVAPEYLDLDCALLAGPPVGRPATPADLAHVGRVLNATHRGAEMFLPYTQRSLAERMARAPAQYGWDRLWLNGGAVAGVWPEGESIAGRLRQPSGEWAESRAAVVLDYGCLPGHEGELLALLRAWCGWLAPRGMSALSLFTSEGRRLRDELLPLAASISRFDLWTPDLAEPPGARERGLYVDAVYF